MHILLLAAVAACQLPADGSLVGLWETMETTRGGIGHTLEFRADGSFVEALSVIADQSYRIGKGKITFAAPPQRPSQRQRGASVKIGRDGDIFVLTTPDDRVARAEMFGKDNSPLPTPGAWRYRHSSGATAFQRFTDDGRFLFRLPVHSSTGCYRVEEHSITFLRGNDIHSAGFAMTDWQLKLQNSKNGATRYRYEPGGPWYPREWIDYRPPPTGEGS